MARWDFEIAVQDSSLPPQPVGNRTRDEPLPSNNIAKIYCTCAAEAYVNKVGTSIKVAFYPRYIVWPGDVINRRCGASQEYPTSSSAFAYIKSRATRQTGEEVVFRIAQRQRKKRTAERVTSAQLKCPHHLDLVSNAAFNKESSSHYINRLSETKRKQFNQRFENRFLTDC